VCGGTNITIDKTTMNKSSRPSHYSLNKKQLYILQITHKFRFITGPLLARHKQTSLSATNIALTRVYKQGYLGKHHDNSYKLQNKPASYYLQNKAIRYLKDNTALTDKALHSCYKDKHMNSKFIDFSLLIYKTFLQLKEQYPDHLFSTANDLRNDDHYPNPLPHLTFYTEDVDGAINDEYMLDIFTDNLFFYIKKRIDQYVAHYDEGEWLRKQYPTIVLLVADSRLKEKTEKYIDQARDGVFADEENLPFAVDFFKANG
jgi:hypothetical protein